MATNVLVTDVPMFAPITIGIAGRTFMTEHEEERSGFKMNTLLGNIFTYLTPLNFGPSLIWYCTKIEGV